MGFSLSRIGESGNFTVNIDMKSNGKSPSVVCRRNDGGRQTINTGWGGSYSPSSILTFLRKKWR